MKSDVMSPGRGLSGRWLASLARLLKIPASVALALFAAVTAPAGLVLDNGFELGAADWDATGVWKPAPSDATSVTTSPREGTRSVRFVPHADRKQVRSELVLRPPFEDIARSHGTQAWDGKFNWGTEYWEGFSIRVVAPLDGYGIICQHHAVPALVNGSVDWLHAAGENSFTIKTQGDSFVIYTATLAANVNGADIVDPAGVVRHHAQTGAATWGTAATEPIPFIRGRWYDFVLHFRLVPDNTGVMQVWTRDGETVGATWVNRVNVTAGVTAYKYDSGKPAGAAATKGVEYRDGQPKGLETFQKIGLYYGGRVTTGEVHYDSIRIWSGPGGSIEAVAPHRRSLATVSATPPGPPPSP